jgi:hypothetical protein
MLCMVILVLPDLDVSNSTQALLKKYGLSGALDAVENWTTPFTSHEFDQELQGLSDGSGVNRTLVNRYHLFGELIQAACSLVVANGSATKSGSLVWARALDWDNSAMLQDSSLILVYHPAQQYGHGQPSMVVTWSGFIGVLTGISSTGVHIGTIGVGYPDDTFGTMRREGNPFMYLMHDALMTEVTTSGVLSRLAAANRTVNLILGLSDLSTSPVGAQYSANALRPCGPTTLEPRAEWHPPIADMVWWAMDWNCPTFDSVMGRLLSVHHGSLDGTTIVRKIFPVVNTGNLHVVVHDVHEGTLLLANARHTNVSSGELDAYKRTYSVIPLEMLWEWPHAAGSTITWSIPTVTGFDCPGW